MDWLKAIAAASCAAIIGSTASAATVVNGSFEENVGPLNGSGWGTFAVVEPWTGTPNIEIQTFATLKFAAQHGDNYAELDTGGNSGMYQDILLDAGSYVLSFFYSPRVDNNTTTNDMSYGVSGAEAYVSETITGAPNNDFPHKVWTEVKSYFTLENEETVRLSFAAINGSGSDGCGNCGALIDNVTIAAVPLPAGLLLMLSAIGAFSFARRRTQA